MRTCEVCEDDKQHFKLLPDLHEICFECYEDMLNYKIIYNGLRGRDEVESECVAGHAKQCVIKNCFSVFTQSELLECIDIYIKYKEKEDKEKEDKEKEERYDIDSKFLTIYNMCCASIRADARIDSAKIILSRFETQIAFLNDNKKLWLESLNIKRNEVEKIINIKLKQVYADRDFINSQIQTML
jgi:hypothetical protein